MTHGKYIVESEKNPPPATMSAEELIVELDRSIAWWSDPKKNISFKDRQYWLQKFKKHRENMVRQVTGHSGSGS